jgi:N-acetylneuraminate synthase
LSAGPSGTHGFHLLLRQNLTWFQTPPITPELIFPMKKLEIQIGNQLVGDGHPCYLIGEIGINHNGSLDIAQNLISVAKNAGCNAVKFQKRTVEIVYTQEELTKPRENPFGSTNGDLKRGLEFGIEQYKKVNEFCDEADIAWFASCWDEPSVDFISQFPVPCYKIASASLTDDNLLRHTRAAGKPIMLSTGMSTIEEIDHAVEILGKNDLIIIHATSTYPANYDEIDLRVIPQLRKRYGVPVGYSGHETGIATSVAAVALGACVVERHITLERSMWGSDQAASLGPSGITQLARDIRLVEMAMGSDTKRVFDREIPNMKKLRRVGCKA